MNETVYSIIDNRGKFVSYNVEDDFYYSSNSVVDAVSLANIKYAETMTSRLNDSYIDGENLAIDDTEYPVKVVEIELNYKVKVVN